MGFTEADRIRHGSITGLNRKRQKKSASFLFFCILGGESESRFCYAESTGIGSRKAEWMITPYMAGAGAGVLKQAAVVQR